MNSQVTKQAIIAPRFDALPAQATQPSFAAPKIQQTRVVPNYCPREQQTTQAPKASEEVDEDDDEEEHHEHHHHHQDHPDRDQDPATDILEALFGADCEIEPCPRQAHVITEEEEKHGTEESDTAADSPPQIQMVYKNQSESAQFVQVPQRKRDMKEKVHCPGCQARFYQMTEMGICHNCVKICQAVETQCQRHGGQFWVRQQADTVVIVVRCARRHEWQTGFVAKQGRKWCRQCQADERQQRRQERVQQDQAQQQRMAQEQAQIFEAAMQQMQQAQKVEEPAHIQQMRRIIRAVVRQTEDTDPIQTMHDLVEAVMAATEDQIAEVFAAEVAADQMVRVVRRVKFMIHPDRNAHPQATDAFQRLSSSSWRLKYTKLLKNFRTPVTRTCTMMIAASMLPCA